MPCAATAKVRSLRDDKIHKFEKSTSWWEIAEQRGWGALLPQKHKKCFLNFRVTCKLPLSKFIGREKGCEMLLYASCKCLLCGFLQVPQTAAVFLGRYGADNKSKHFSFTVIILWIPTTGNALSVAESLSFCWPVCGLWLSPSFWNFSPVWGVMYLCYKGRSSGWAWEYVLCLSTLQCLL